MKTVGHEKYGNQWMSDNDVDCLMYAKRFIEREGHSPIYSQIAFYLGLTKNQVVRSMSNLEKIGMIHYQRQRARGYVITRPGQMYKPAGYTTSKLRQVWGHHELTDMELETMRSINSLFSEYGIPPSFTEVAERAGLSSTAHVSYILRALKTKGYLHNGLSTGNQFKKIIERTEKGVKVGLECPVYS